MNPISVQNINEAIDKLNAFDEDAFEAMFEQVMLEQPQLVGFLLELEDELPEIEYESILDLFFVIYESFKQSGRTMSQVTEDELADTTEKHLAEITRLEEIEEEEEATALLDSMFDGHPQKEMMDFVLSDIGVRQAAGEFEAEDSNPGFIIAVCNATIDLLHQHAQQA
jgi:hypothetical protein